MFRRKRELPDDWQRIAQQWLRQWPLLDALERRRVRDGAKTLLSKRWEASYGFAIDDTMRATVALSAALLYAGRDDEAFPNVTAVVVHPTTMVLRGERPGPFPGTMTNAPMSALGHTSARGPVYIAWDAVQRDRRMPRGADNVILHEFAHKIDALNGAMDGTPPLADQQELRAWVAICTAELAALRRGERSVLRPYAAKNPSEFFAVATEVFFERPLILRTQKPELYGVLARFYRQDTAAREPVDPAVTTTTTPTTTTTAVQAPAPFWTESREGG